MGMGEDGGVDRGTWSGLACVMPMDVRMPAGMTVGLPAHDVVSFSDESLTLVLGDEGACTEVGVGAGLG